MNKRLNAGKKIVLRFPTDLIFHKVFIFKKESVNKQKKTNKIIWNTQIVCRANLYFTVRRSAA